MRVARLPPYTPAFRDRILFWEDLHAGADDLNAALGNEARRGAAFRPPRAPSRYALAAFGSSSPACAASSRRQKNRSTTGVFPRSLSIRLP